MTSIAIDRINTSMWRRIFNKHQYVGVIDNCAAIEQLIGPTIKFDRSKAYDDILQLLNAVEKISNKIQKECTSGYFVRIDSNDGCLYAHSYTLDEGVMLKLSGIQLLANNNKNGLTNGNESK